MPSPMEPLQRLLVALTAVSHQRNSRQLGRKAVALGARLFRRGAKDSAALAGRLESFDRVAYLFEQETSSWVDAITIVENGGSFDAADLRCWLALAEKARVAAVPAHEILHLSEAEMNAASGSVELPEGRAVDAMRKGAAEYLASLRAEGADIPSTPDEPIDYESLKERLFAAMDDVPEGWMVRSARCGGSNLKALAGAGAAGPEAPEVMYGPELEFGPGWIRKGNRRRVDVSDERTVELAAQGPSSGSTFLARPWVPAARYLIGDDPHRHGTPFAGKGIWPAEWRAFAESGRVVGVAAYYGWVGEATPQNARIALQVREHAQAVVDTATRLLAWPRSMDIEFIRSGKAIEDPKIARSLEIFGRETVSCTLDFIEAEEGLMLLEGGPACSPFGGGHPCAFAGCGGPPSYGNMIDVHGVAFKLMDHVLMGDPRTWTEGDRTCRVLSWDDVEELASRPESQPGDACPSP